LSTSREDFRLLGEVLTQANQDGRVVVLGSQEAITAANRERGGFLDVQKVL